MDEEMYTRQAKPSKRRVEPENQTKQKAHGDKLKNETSAADSYRKKLRHGKKDNSLTSEELKKKARLRKQGRKKIYTDEVLRAKAGHSVADQINPDEERDDNPGTDAFESGCIVAETGIRKGQHAIDKTKAESYSKKLHARNEHLDAVQGAKGAKAAGEAGEGSQSVAAQNARKKLMQKEFAEAAHKKQAAETANSFGNIAKRFTDKAEDLVGRLAEWLKEFMEDHPGIFLITAVILVVVLVISASLTSCSALAGAGNDITIVTSFTADDDDIIEVENDYVELESDLQDRLDHIETEYPGYDEYQYSLAEISHNPFELAALLTVLYEDYTPSEVQTMLQTIFDCQYTLTTEEVVERRTRPVIVVDPETGEEHEEEEEYDYHILKVTLTNGGISAAVNALGLSDDQMQRYLILLETKGNKPYLFGDNPYASPEVPEEYEDYEVPREYMTDEKFARMLHEAEKYLGYPYVWGGSNPDTSFDCSGFVSYVINHCGNGWNYGRLTANGWKNSTARVSASDVHAGDLVFFKGTYNTSGASHVGIVVDPVNKIMIHCGNPIQYASYDTAYWRAHAYCFGRLP